MAKKGTTARGGGSRGGGETGKARRGAEAARRGPKGSRRRVKRRADGRPRRHPGNRSAGGKVGSSGRKAAQFASRRDFGVPARRATPRGRAPDSAVGLPRNEEGRSGAAGDRTHGVGLAPLQRRQRQRRGPGHRLHRRRQRPGFPARPHRPDQRPGRRDGPQWRLRQRPDRPARGRNQKGRIRPRARRRLDPHLRRGGPQRRGRGHHPARQRYRRGWLRSVRRIPLAHAVAVCGVSLRLRGTRRSHLVPFLRRRVHAPPGDLGRARWQE